MTNGDKIKLGAELAGKAMASVISEHLANAISAARASGISIEEGVARISVRYADALMAELGIKGEV